MKLKLFEFEPARIFYLNIPVVLQIEKIAIGIRTLYVADDGFWNRT